MSLSNESGCKLQVNNLTKSFSGVVALKGVSIAFQEAEVHAIVGENGAGKSTLIKSISGATRPDSGEIVIDGQAYSRMTPHQAIEYGIEVIYQELSLFHTMNVMENIFMSDLPGGRVMADFSAMRKQTEAIFRKMRVNIAPDTLVRELSSAQMQMVEIAKAIRRGAKILIMDEPTAALTKGEINILFQIVRDLREEGTCVIYISHRLNEIFELSDRVTVMRDGEVISTMNTADSNRENLIALMVGRPLSENFSGHSCQPGEVIMEARDLVAPKVDHVSLQIRQGEILGLGGLVGSGRTETVRLLFGADKKLSGTILRNGQEITLNHPRDALRHRIALCPEDRKIEGALQNMSIGFNMTLPILRRISKLLVINRKKDNSVVDRYKNSLSIKTPSVHQLVRNLSGGNQQKVVISKWLASEADILIFDEPTHGIDVGAKNEIYQLIYKLVDHGKAIVVVSSDMEEIIGLCDRIVVICEGRVSGELQRAEFTQEKILDLASGNT
jgi:ribose transport system ATP-binding protein